MRLYNYGGKTDDNLLVVNTADIKFEEVFNSFSHSSLPAKEVSLCKNIILKATRAEAEKSITMSDDRLIYIANKLMVKYPDAMLHTGINEWVIVYEFLKRFYDKSLPNIDSIIRAINLYIGKMFSDTNMSGYEYRELKSLSDNMEFSGIHLSEYNPILPKFVMEALSQKFVADKKQSKEIDRADINDAFGELLSII